MDRGLLENLFSKVNAVRVDEEDEYYKVLSVLRLLVGVCKYLKEFPSSILEKYRELIRSYIYDEEITDALFRIFVESGQIKLGFELADSFGYHESQFAAFILSNYKDELSDLTKNLPSEYLDLINLVNWAISYFDGDKEAFDKILEAKDSEWKRYVLLDILMYGPEIEKIRKLSNLLVKYSEICLDNPSENKDICLKLSPILARIKDERALNLYKAISANLKTNEKTLALAYLSLLYAEKYSLDDYLDLLNRELRDETTVFLAVSKAVETLVLHDYVNKAAVLSMKQRDHMRVLTCYLKIAKTCLLKGDKDRAIQYVKLAYDLIRDVMDDIIGRLVDELEEVSEESSIREMLAEIYDRFKIDFYFIDVALEEIMDILLTAERYDLALRLFTLFVNKYKYPRELEYYVRSIIACKKRDYDSLVTVFKKLSDMYDAALYKIREILPVNEYRDLLKLMIRHLRDDEDKLLMILDELIELGETDIVIENVEYIKDPSARSYLMLMLWTHLKERKYLDELSEMAKKHKKTNPGILYNYISALSVADKEMAVKELLENFKYLEIEEIADLLEIIFY